MVGAVNQAKHTHKHTDGALPSSSKIDTKPKNNLRQLVLYYEACSNVTLTSRTHANVSSEEKKINSNSEDRNEAFVASGT